MVYSLVLLIADQRVGNVAEGSVDGLLVTDQQLFVLRLGRLVVSRPPARIEDWQIQHAAHRVRHAGPADDAEQVCGLKAAGGREIDAGKECRLRDSDAGIGRDQLLLGLPQIGPALQQRGRQPGWHLRRLGLIGQALPRATGPGCLASR